MSNSNTLLLRRQLIELNRNPVEGFSAGMRASDQLRLDVYANLAAKGLVDEDNLLEWEVMIIG
jgi:hypothetical protein